GVVCFFFQAEDGIRDWSVTGVQTCALPISRLPQLAGVPVRRAGLLDGHAGRATVTADCGRARCRQGELRVPAGREPRERTGPARSEERRVGEEGRARGGAEQVGREKEKKGG